MARKPTIAPCRSRSSSGRRRRSTTTGRSSPKAAIRAQQCGWLKDRFGLSWQVVPEALTEMIGNPESEKSERAMAAMLGMKKLDIAALERAYSG